MTPNPHPDTIPHQTATKKISRGGMEAIENKAIAEYLRVYEEKGREEAERIFFSFFNRTSYGRQ